MPLIGVYVHLWHPYGLDILRGVSRFAAKQPNWECHLPWPGSASEHSRLPADHLDGLIIRVGGAHDVPADFGADLKRVVIANTDQLATPVDIAWNNHEIGRLAGEHLREQGHRKIFVMGQFTSWPYQRQRADGLLAAVAGQTITARLIDLDAMDADGFSLLIRDLPQPAGIFATNDPIGSQVLHAARAAGRRVPEELAVVAAGDNEIFCDMASPPLSSVALPGEQVGYLAAARLHELMAHGTRPPPAVVAPRYVTVRRSSDMLAMDDELIAHAVRTIHREATRGLTVDQVRSSVPLSRRALELRFKKAVGRTIEQEMLRVRLNAAKRLLADTNLSMAEVADRAGFSSAQRLSAVFAREERQPPSDYRRRLRTAL